jgi:hypothetical protein
LTARFADLTQLGYRPAAREYLFGYSGPQNESEHVEKASNVAAGVALLVPILYLVGFGYDAGHLGEYGVDAEFFPRTVQEYLVFAFYAFLDVAVGILDFSKANWKLIAIYSGYLASVTLAVVFIGKGNISPLLIGRTKRLMKHWLFDYIALPIAAWFVGIVIPYALVVLAAAVIVLPLFGYLYGRDSAQKEISAHVSCPEIVRKDCIALYEGGKLLTRGRFVARSSTHIALYDNGKTSIFSVEKKTVEAGAFSQVSSDKENAAKKTDARK